MARPKTKEELLSLSQENFDQIFVLIENLSPEQREQAGVNDTWSVKDILAHLKAWHEMFFTWYEVGSQGEKPEMPAPGYTWKTTPELNEKIYQEHRGQPYETIVDGLHATHQKMMALISSHSDEELFTKKKYKWTGSTSLGSYAVSASSSHYQWAIDLIKKWKKTPPES
ncbi:MAG: DfsB family protein [Chloroflexi bacterium]|nr:MAG: DfsB family protein [Chloroflexota bacterium]MBL1193097.1 DfsB family protein [Chloroflexota bacterium]NOH10390.1 ClbS/DfsB family four-helix bundle protein [Chloroflexota bacterium]